MPATGDLILGEFTRTLDERFRLSIPGELLPALSGDEANLILAKERPGCVSLWNAAVWEAQLAAEIELVKNKIQAGKLSGRLNQVQTLGRLLSTRHQNVSLAGRGRLLVPEGFRPFLNVEAGGEVMIVGAAICLEIWQPRAWLKYLRNRMPRFRRLLDQLSS